MYKREGIRENVANNEWNLLISASVQALTEKAVELLGGYEQ